MAHKSKRILQFVFAVSIVAGFSASAQAQELEVTIIEFAADDLDTCSLGKVAGLKSSGDGFLAVRTGPGTNYKKLDEIKNGEPLWLFEEKGDWVGVVYKNEFLSCGAIDKDRPVPHSGKKGWVHKNWVEFVAG